MKHIREAYIFCPVCAHAMLDVDDFRQCSLCGHRVFVENQSVTVSIALTDTRGYIMLPWRLKEPFANTWEINGGFAKKGESLETAGLRHLHQEVGNNMQLTDLEYYFNCPDMYPYQGYEYPIVCVHFAARILSGQPEISEQVGRIEFFAPYKVPFTGFGFDSDRQAMTKLISRR